MDINGGQLTQTNYNPVFPGTVFTGPVIVGNIPHSDGLGTLAGAGETSTGTANSGYVTASQQQVVTQAGSTTAFTTSIVIPAQSLIVGIDLYVSTVWASSATVQITDTASNTYTTAQAPGTVGKLALTTGTVKAQTLQWENVGSSDVNLVITSSTGTGGSGLLVVNYVQGCNAAQSA